jgi:hypothetical protein
MNKFLIGVLLLALGMFLNSAGAEDTQQTPQAAKEAATPSDSPAAAEKAVLEPQAIAILKAASNRLAEARTMTFTAVSTYESPSRIGPPLAYTTLSEVTLQRPDKLRVLTKGDGPPSEFYYNDKTMMAFAPAENLVAVADAPPTIDAALKAAFDEAAIYFPFTDVLVADPYKDLAEGLKLAFVIGQSQVVGGTTTDMIAIANDAVFAQIWIGADDKLPRMIRAVYAADPLWLRHQVEFSDWRLDAPISADAFTSSRAGSASQMEFARPEPKLPPDTEPPVKDKPSAKDEPPKSQR